jgi:uncharacterized membrane protein
MKIEIIPAIISYILLYIGIVWIAIPNARQSSGSKFMKALKNGGLLGLVIYGVYNATNAAIFKNYDITVGIIDTLWGVVVGTLVVYLYLLTQK